MSFSYTYDLTHTLQYNMVQQQNAEIMGADENLCLGTRYQPSWKYVWNEYMLSPIRSQVHPRWLLYLVHGNHLSTS